MKIIFDIDGTLFNSRTIAIPAFKQVMQTVGYPVPDEATLLNTLGYPIAEIWQMLLPGADQKLLKRAGQLMEEAEIALLAAGQGELYPQVSATIKQLAEDGHQLYTLSNCQVPYLQQVINTFNLEHFFTELHCEGMHPGKTKTQILRKILQGDTHAIMVGDRYHDITAGKENGIVTVWCQYGFSQEDEIEQPDFIITNMAELIDIVESITLATKHKGR